MIFCLIIACSWSIFKIFDDRRLIIGDSFFFLLKSNFKKITCVLRNNTTICKVFYFFEQKSSTRSVCYYVTRSVVSLSLVRRLHSSVEGNKRERERERNLRIRRNKSSGVLLWRKIYIFFLRLSGIQTQIVRRKSSSITLKTAIQIAEQRISLFNVPSTNVTHVSRWQRLQVFRLILFSSNFFFFLLLLLLFPLPLPPPPPPSPLSSYFYPISIKDERITSVDHETHYYLTNNLLPMIIFPEQIIKIPEWRRRK